MSDPRGRRDWLAVLGESLHLKESQLRWLRQAVVVGLVGVLLILLYNVFGAPTGGGTPRVPVGATPVTNPEPEPASLALVDAVLSRQLSERLSLVEGAGRVDVTVTLDSSEERVYGQNTVRTSRQITERDNSGGTRTTTETTDNAQAVMGRTYSQGSGDVPALVKTVTPRIKGVVVVADGAHSAVVAAGLTQAVQALLDVPINRVVVLPREGSARP